MSLGSHVQEVLVLVLVRGGQVLVLVLGGQVLVLVLVLGVRSLLTSLLCKSQLRFDSCDVTFISNKRIFID